MFLYNEHSINNAIRDSFQFLFIPGKPNQNDDKIDNPNDDAYENLKPNIGQSTKMNDPTRPEKKTSEAVNLEDTEVVTASENIYYDI